MLQQLCENICNYFIQKQEQGTFEIAGGTISLPFLLDGQRFLISGSVLNDGMYTYHETGIKDDDDNAFAEGVGLKDETFAGTICALAVRGGAEGRNVRRNDMRSGCSSCGHCAVQ